MDRWFWVTESCTESTLARYDGVRLYDGEDKTQYDDGSIRVTPKKLEWRDLHNSKCVIALPLRCVLQVERTAGGIGKSPKLVLHLGSRIANGPPGPVSHSRHGFIRISFKNHGESEFHMKLMDAIQTKAWQECSPSSDNLQTASGSDRRVKGVGIVGIERKMEERRMQTEQNISAAFQDLTKLMDKAKEMVILSKAIAAKITDKQGDITEDETIKFKSYLLSLGIPNPVTKETHGSGTHYHMQLAKEVCNSLLPALQDCGGIILLSDAYCRINRARGMELLSPEDMINACKILGDMKLPMRMRTYESGVTVLQLESHSEDKAVAQAVKLVQESKCLTAQQLSNLVNVSVLLAKERLLLAEQHGKLCRDDSVEGLCFYPNLFVTNIST